MRVKDIAVTHEPLAVDTQEQCHCGARASFLIHAQAKMEASIPWCGNDDCQGGAEFAAQLAAHGPPQD